MWFLFLYAIAIIFLAIYLWFKKQFEYFKKLGFPFVPGKFPMGSIGGVGTSIHISEFFKREFDRFKHQGPAFGIYFMGRPVIVPTDTELVKEILVNNFDSFQDHGYNSNEKGDPLSKNLFFLNGQEWKDLREKLTPTFTPSRMKMMFNIVEAKVDRMIDYLKPIGEDNGSIEMKEVLSSYTTEAIASVALGIETECLGKPDNPFRKIAKSVFEPPAWKNIKNFIVMASETITNLFNLDLNSQETTDFFMGTVKDSFKYRVDHKVKRNDFFQLIMKIHQDNQITFDEMAANCYLFLLAGFETSSSVLTFAAYELALNQEIQDRLRDEINEVLENHNGEVTYDAIMEMKYLDRVFNETIRKWPIGDIQMRKANRDFLIPKTKLVIPAGTLVMITSNGLHHDERYWENPQKFCPDRFTQENIKKRPQFSYLPFSEGPRICIGLRYGTMQIKLGLVKLISNFKFLPSSKTSIPMKLSPSAAFQRPLNDMWLKLQKL